MTARSSRLQWVLRAAGLVVLLAACDLVRSLQPVLFAPALRGQVLDPEGRPVAGAEVRVSNYFCGNEPWWALQKERVGGWLGRDRTDSEGRFVVRLGAAHFSVEAKGFAPWHRPQNPPEGEAALTVQLLRSNSERFAVTGQVLDRRGAPIPKAPVAVFERWANWHQSQTCPVHTLFEAQADAQGRFRLEVPFGDYLALATVEGARSPTVEVHSPAESLTLQLEK